MTGVRFLVSYFKPIPFEVRLGYISIHVKEKILQESTELQPWLLLYIT